MNFHFTGDLKEWSDKVYWFFPPPPSPAATPPIPFNTPPPFSATLTNEVISTGYQLPTAFLSSVILLHSCLTHLLILSLFSGSFLSYYSSKTYIWPCQQYHALNLREIIAEYFKDLLGQTFTDHPLSPLLSSLCLHPLSFRVGFLALTCLCHFFVVVLEFFSAFLNSFTQISKTDFKITTTPRGKS